MLFSTRLLLSTYLLPRIQIPLNIIKDAAKFTLEVLAEFDQVFPAVLQPRSGARTGRLLQTCVTCENIQIVLRVMGDRYF